MLNKVSASIRTSCPSNSTNPYATSSPLPPITPPTSYYDSNIYSQKLRTSPAHHSLQHLNKPHTSSLPSPKRVPSPASNITATTTFGWNFIMKPTMLAPSTSPYYQVFCHPRHPIPSSPFAIASHQTNYHHGYLSLLSNANYTSHYLTHLTNPSAHADVDWTHLAITSSNVDTSTRSPPTTQSAMVLPPLLHLSFQQPGTSYPCPNSMLNHSSTYPLTHMPPPVDLSFNQDQTSPTLINHTYLSNAL